MRMDEVVKVRCSAQNGGLTTNLVISEREKAKETKRNSSRDKEITVIKYDRVKSSQGEQPQ
jgi:hypothetical protein